jgi:hypothetical protein
MLAQVLVVMQANSEEVLEKLEMNNKEMQSNESSRFSVHSSLSNSNFSLPIFDGDLGVNSLFHIKQLEKFIQLRGVLPAHQLAVARKSGLGNLSKQWLEAIYDKLKDYDDFRKTF